MVADGSLVVLIVNNEFAQLTASLFINTVTLQPRNTNYNALVVLVVQNSAGLLFARQPILPLP